MNTDLRALTADFIAGNISRRTFLRRGVALTGSLSLTLALLDQSGAAAAAQTAGGTLTHGSAQEPDRFWGPITGLTVSAEVAQLVNATLVEIDGELQYVPSLATEVPTLENGGIAPDGLTYTFRLHQGVTWHDGQAFTSGDVRFTYDVLMMDGVDVRGRTGWDQIASVETPDDSTVVYTFKAVYAPFLDRIADTQILPRHILGELDAEAINNHEWFRQPVGLGPFVFQEWAPGSHITVTKNPNYFRTGQPSLDTIVYKIVPDANSLVNQLETGDIDTRVRLSNEDVGVVNEFGNVDVVTAPSVTPWVIWLNNTRPPLDDRLVRQALAHGFDKAGICQELLGGLVEPAWGLISPLSWAYNPDIPRFEYDPDRANQLLDEAGWSMGSDGIREKDDMKLSFELMNIAGEQERVQILSLVQAQWRQIGVEATIRMVDVGTMWGNALPNGEYQAAYSYTGRAADPDISSHYLSPEFNPAANFAGFSNPEVDELLTQAFQTVDQDQRKELYFRAQEIVAEECAYLFVYWLANHTAISQRVQGYRPAPAYVEFWNANEWSVAQ